MLPEDRRLLRELLTRQRVLALSVLVDGVPYVGQLPFALRGDFGALWIHASRLARHSEGLHPDAPFAVLIQQPDAAGADPFRLARVGLRGRVRRLDRGDPDHDEARRRFVAKLPTSRLTFELADFELYELVVADGRFVAGFGRTYGLSTRFLRALAEEPEQA